MMQNVSILGSTGSIGRQSLDVIEKLGNINVVALTAGTSVDMMAEQCRKFKPELAVMASKEAADRLAEAIADLPTRVSWGEAGLIEAAAAIRRLRHHRCRRHGGSEAHSGRHPRPQAHRPGQQGDAGLRR